MNINEKTRKALLRFQQNEITESLLYTQLAAIEKDPSNKEVLLQIANDEKGHYTILKKYTGKRSPRINYASPNTTGWHVSWGLLSPLS